MRCICGPHSACQVNGVPTRNVCNKIVLPASASAAAITAAQNKLMGLFPPALNITLEVRRVRGRHGRDNLVKLILPLAAQRAHLHVTVLMHITVLGSMAVANSRGDRVGVNGRYGGSI